MGEIKSNNLSDSVNLFDGHDRKILDYIFFDQKCKLINYEIKCKKDKSFYVKTNVNHIFFN